MSDKKNIDRLFQEKLKDFEAIPNNTVWESIATEIHSSNGHKKAFPVWWKIAGIAASLILLLSLGGIIFKTSEVVPEEKIVNTDSDNNKSNQDGFNQNTNDSIEMDEGINVANEELQKNDADNPVDLLNNLSKKPNSVVKNDIDKLKALTSSKKAINKEKADALLLSSKELEKNIGTTVAENTNNTDAQQNKTKDNTVDKTQISSDLNELKKVNKTQNTDVASSTSPKKETITANNKTTSNITKDVELKDDGDLTITEAIAASNEENLDEENKEEIDRWKVAPNIAPVYFNSLGTGSSIHNQFNNNSKTGDVNMSYGVSASYAINKKLSVRTGIHKVSLGYSTNDIVVYNNIQPAPINPLLRNIAFNEASQGVSFISVNEFNFGQVPGVLSNRINASIDQKLGFLEVPLELQYNFTSNNKLGISVIGGVSALFLNNNEIYSVQDGTTNLLGKATNVNNTSYSANLGLGLNYEISKKVNLNLEPVFKYQINTFNNTSGNFKPYFIGVYTGFSFKF